MSETADLTVQILREIRDDIRGVKEEARKTNERLDQTNERLDQTNERLNAVENTLKDMAGQFTLIARFVKNSQKRTFREIDEVKRRVTVLEERAGIKPD